MTQRMRGLQATLAVGLVLSAGAAAISASAAEHGRVSAFQALVACQSVQPADQRAACYDTAAAALTGAEARGEIVVIDRAQATAAHRESFGLPIPSLQILTRALKPEEVDRVAGVVRSARADVNGRWTMSLEDGAVWRQISGDLDRAPRAGSKVVIRKGSIGSFLMNVDGQPAIKVHRDS
jgi:hypothetical protein